MLKYGYARVSTKYQKLERQVEALKRYGLDERDIFCDKYTGTKIAERDQLNELLKRIREGDTLVLKEIDRLGRNHKETKEIIIKLIEGGVDIIVLDSQVFQMYIENMKKENKSFMDKVILSQLEGVIDILLLIAEEERNKIIHRTSEGRLRARERGVQFGVPKKLQGEKLDRFKELYSLFMTRQVKQVEILKELGISKPTFKKYADKINIKF